MGRGTTLAAHRINSSLRGPSDMKCTASPFFPWGQNYRLDEHREIYCMVSYDRYGESFVVLKEALTYRQRQPAFMFKRSIIYCRNYEVW